ncbi:MAG: antA/AntB antirepressor family protein [Acidithiobacillus sp.]|nr:antA/AntB antirepressor family protein [Acidithiobacillus sp.]
MKDLISIQQQAIGTEQTRTVNARDLHTFLENKDKFATWIKDRIDQFEFVENQDFVSFSENSEKPHGGRPSEEYHLTLNMAKELSMVERTPKGKEARQYFIECERVARSAKVPALPAPEPGVYKALIATTDEGSFWKAFKKHAARLKDAPLAWQNGGLVATRIALEMAGRDIGVHPDVFAPFIHSLPTREQAGMANPLKIDEESWKAILSVTVYGRKLGEHLLLALEKGDKNAIGDLRSQGVSITARPGHLFIARSSAFPYQHPAVSALHDLIKRSPDAIEVKLQLGDIVRKSTSGVMIATADTPLSV